MPIPTFDAALSSRSSVTSYRALLEGVTSFGLANLLLKEAAARQSFEGAFCLRHDVDYHLERALLMGLVEARSGIRSTFFLLPPGHDGHVSNYYGYLDGTEIVRSARMVTVAKLLQDMGHEIGLHTDFVSLAKRTGLPVADLIAREMEFFARSGISILGSAAHGSRFSRRHNFVNYEIFAECSYDQATVHVDRNEPLSHGRTVDSGDFSFQLNSVAMQSVGLSYEAYFVGRCVYLMDSGGQLTVRWFEGRSPKVEAMSTFSLEALRSAFGRAGCEGMQILVHADHWTFSPPDGEIRSVINTASRAAAVRASSHLLPDGFLYRCLSRLKNDPTLEMINYQSIDLGPCGSEVVRRLEEEAKRFLGAASKDKARVVLCLFAGPDPEAVDRALRICRDLEVPYTLFTFVRWNHQWGLAEPYPVDWSALAGDVASGLATVAYLHNATHLANGSPAEAERGFHADLDFFRELGVPCRIMAPYPGPRASGWQEVRQEAWWLHSREAPLCVEGPLQLYAAARYSDAMLPSAGKARGDLNPLTWTKAHARAGERIVLILHPHHYGPDLRDIDEALPRWMELERTAEATRP